MDPSCTTMPVPPCTFSDFYMFYLVNLTPNWLCNMFCCMLYVGHKIAHPVTLLFFSTTVFSGFICRCSTMLVVHACICFTNLNPEPKTSTSRRLHTPATYLKVLRKASLRAGGASRRSGTLGKCLEVLMSPSRLDEDS